MRFSITNEACGACPHMQERGMGFIAWLRKAALWRAAWDGRRMSSDLAGSTASGRRTMMPRPRRWRSRSLIGGLVGCAIVVAGVASSASASSGGNSKAPVVIGTSLSLSGDFATDGVSFEQGYKLWAAYQNAHGGLLGRKVNLDIISDGSSPSQVVTNYQKFLSVDHVNLVFGPYSTLLAVPAQKIVNRYGYALPVGAGGGPTAFATGLHNYFDTGPVAINITDSFVKWITSLPASERPKTAAYATSNDPLMDPIVQKAKAELQKAGIKTVYSSVFPSEVTDYTPIADAMAASKAQVAIIGSTAVPDVAPFVQTFVSDHYNPKVFMATSGPDQGAAYAKAVGSKNTDGTMFPNGWYPGATFSGDAALVKAYLAKYGGKASAISADIAEAFSVGQIMADAVKATHSLSNSKIMAYLHSGVKLNTVVGPVNFNKLGENTAAAGYVMQWQHGTVVQAYPSSSPSTKVEFPKPVWGS